MNNVFIYCEVEDGQPAEVSLEILTKGRALADQIGAKVEVIVLGSGLKKIEDDYRSGKLLTGELKQITIEKIQKFIVKHQENREKAKDTINDMLLTPSNLTRSLIYHKIPNLGVVQ